MEDLKKFIGSSIRIENGKEEIREYIFDHRMAFQRNNEEKMDAVEHRLNHCEGDTVKVKRSNQ